MPRLICREARPFTPEAAKALFPCTGRIAELLYARGIDTFEEADAFLNPSPEQLNDPNLLHGVTECIRLFTQARDEKKKIVVYGDYDADGICAASILFTALRRFGIEAGTYTPLRAEGYGLNKPAIEKLRQSYDILTTVDLGITNHEEVRYAQSLGMTVVVTDHHRLEGDESPADIVIHPMLGDYPCKKLCGTGVAFKIAQGLLGLAGCKDLLDLAALGTVADLVPLIGENRVIVALGLPLIEQRKRIGIRALLKAAAWDKEVTSDTIAYQLAPRLNSTGRLEDAGDGVRLMLSEDEAEAERLAEHINDLNVRRRTEENNVVTSCEKLVENHDFISEWTIIVRGEAWNPGVVGLAAGRLTQRFGCPSCVVTKTGDHQLTGSLRSVAGVNIHECLTACKDLLVRYGGHEAAAGVTLLESNYEAFCQRLQAEVMKARPSCFLPHQEYDLAVGIEELTDSLLADISRLAPFGLGNTMPLLASFGASLDERRAVGDGSHLKLSLRQENALIDGIAFGKGHLAAKLPEKVDAVYTLNSNTYRAVTRLQIHACAILPDESSRLQMILRRDEATESLLLLKALAALPPAGQAPNVVREESDEQLQTIVCGLERGHLLIGRSVRTAAKWLKLLPDLFLDDDENPQLFPHLMIQPIDYSAGSKWRHIWLLDGALAPEEAASWHRSCPDAVIHVLPQNGELSRLALLSLPSKDEMRKAFLCIRDRVSPGLDAFAKTCGMLPAKALASILALQECGLVRYRETPFTALLDRKIKADPCELSLLWKRLNLLAQGELNI